MRRIAFKSESIVPMHLIRLWLTILITTMIGFSSLSLAQQKDRIFQAEVLTADESWFDERSGNDIGQWWTPRYLVDYALVAGGIAGYAIGKDIVPQSNSMIGPSYDPDNLIELFESDQLNKPYLQQDIGESVPEYWIHRSIGVSGAFLIGMEWREQRNGRGSMQRIHQTFVGYAEAVALNAALTELLKPVFARLRPDFRERALRFHCGDLTSPEFDTFCEGFRDMPLDEDPDVARDLLEDGRKSFFSGHSSNSFSLFGYTSLAIGGRYVWGENATRRSRIAGITAQAGMMSFATYIAASRVDDGRHFVSDTVVGAAVGAAIANFSYWRRFDRSGEMRGKSSRNSNPQTANGSGERAELRVLPWTNQHGNGLSMMVRF